MVEVEGLDPRVLQIEVRQPDGGYVNLSAVFGNRLLQKANDWLAVCL